MPRPRPARGIIAQMFPVQPLPWRTRTICLPLPPAPPAGSLTASCPCLQPESLPQVLQSPFF